MMFSCCHPRLPEEAQVALILNILCGFGAQRDRERVPHRPRRDREADLARQEGARRARSGCSISADAEFAARLSAVRRALYLLFNEGYHGASAESAVRAELCARRCG